MSSGRLLRYARRRAGLSQRALALAAGVPQPAIARIESGTSSPRLDTLERLLRATGHSLELTPRLGRGVDRSLIRAYLSLTPEQRVTAAARAAQRMVDFTAAVRHALGRA